MARQARLRAARSAPPRSAAEGCLGERYNTAFPIWHPDLTTYHRDFDISINELSLNCRERNGSPGGLKQDGRAYNGYFGCSCYQPLFLFNQFGDLETKGILHAIRLKANKVLQESIGHLLRRPTGRPPNQLHRFHASFSYQAGSWDRKRRVVAKVDTVRSRWPR